MRYFQVVNDMRIRGRRFLAAPRNDAGEPVDPRIFTEGRAQPHPVTLTFPVQNDGFPLDLILGPFDVPIARPHVGETLEQFDRGCVQRIPARVENDPDPYEVLNIVALRDCFDERASTFERFTQDDPVRPDLAGEISLVMNLVIDPTRAGGADVFRLTSWRLPITVSERVRVRLHDRRVSGVRFISVMPGEDTPAERGSHPPSL